MAMEKPTCDRFDIILYDIQVVELPLSGIRHALLSHKRIDDAFQGSDPPEWASSLSYGRAYHGLVYRNVLSFDPLSPVGRESLAHLAERRLSRSLSALDVVEPESLRSDLVLEPNTFEWLLVHELRMGVTHEELSELLSADPAENWYTAMRSMLVRSSEDGPDTRIPWVIHAERRAREMVLSYFRRIGGYEPAGSDILFPPNCGNLSFFFVPGDPDRLRPYGENELCLRLLGQNVPGERIAAAPSRAIRADALCYNFGGRFHTIIVDSHAAVMRYMPLQFHAQYTWAYLRTAHSLVCSIEDDCVRNRFAGEDDGFIDCVINNVQYEMFISTEFARSVESDARILDYIDESWSLSRSLRQLEQFVENLSSYLERSLQRRANRISSRQEVILFALSLIQLIALISVWGDYLGLLRDYGGEDFSSPPFSLFASAENLRTFNLLLPLLLALISIVIMAFCALSRRSRKG